VHGIGRFVLKKKRKGVHWWSLWDYTKKVIYCGIRNIVTLPIYYTTLISIQRRNKVVGHLMQGLLTMHAFGEAVTTTTTWFHQLIKFSTYQHITTN
jgi:hypothetical protein